MTIILDTAAKAKKTTEMFIAFFSEKHYSTYRKKWGVCMNDYVVVKNLTKKYGDIVAVDDLSFTVGKEEIFGFLGPNGAGKSTTLNVLCSLTDYVSGEITVGGMRLQREGDKIKSLIGLVPQEIAVYPTLTVYENVTFFASLYGFRGKALREAAMEALEFVGLSDQRKRVVSKLSGGMRRRLNIACGIAHNPKLVVMDEPTVGVDAQSREHIMDSIRKLRARGMTVIYTSHYMPEVQEICDRIAIIDRGRLVAVGTEAELVARITDTKTIEIETELAALKDINELIKDILQLPDIVSAERDPAANLLRIEAKITLSTLNPILRLLMDRNAPIYRIDSKTPDLESTYLTLTGRELREG